MGTLELDPATAKFRPRAELLYEYDPVTHLQLVRIIESFEVAFFRNGHRIGFCIPAGYKSDGASLPAIVRPLWRTLDPRTLLGALVHDAGYSSQGGRRGIPGFPGCGFDAGVILSKAEVDRLFYLFIRANGTSWLRARLYYLAVSWFGGRAWNDPN